MNTTECSAVMCPDCGMKSTHHDCVSIYERKAEDSHRGLRVKVSGLDIPHRSKLTSWAVEVDEDSEMSGNPSRRRQGLVIRMWCEDCGAIWNVLIAQHKGQTLISTEMIRSGLGAGERAERR